MAIKGKGRTKGRQVARAPRREPVPVPVPFFRRRWVQIGLAFVIGLGVATTTVWATNGVRDNRRIEDEAADLIAQKTALETWRAKLDVQLATVGVLQYPNPPSVGERLATVLGQIVRGEETSISAEQLRQDADALKAAAKELEDYDLSDVVPLLDLPLLAVAGARDGAMPETMRKTFGVLPPARYVEIEAAGHVPNLERPEQFNSEVLRFLSSFSSK